MQKPSCVVFSPENMTLVKRGPSLRRKFLDGAISQQRIRYAAALAKYNQIINQRNALLKDIHKHQELKDTLPIWDDSLAVTGAIILKERMEYIKELKIYAQKFHDDISSGKEELSIEYISNAGVKEEDTLSEITEKLRLAYEKSRKDDYHTGYTNIGPHRDDIEIKIDGLSARSYGSQGQQRTIALSLKLAEIRIARQMLDEPPVLLLDDVLSELDLDRQKFLVSEIDDVQLFITSAELNDEVIKDLRGGTLFRIEEGTVTRVDKY